MGRSYQLSGTKALQKISSRVSGIPACVVVALMGLVVDIPLYTAIALIWGEIMKSSETRGKELVDANIITTFHLNDWLQTKGCSQETTGIGLPSYAFLHTLLFSIKSGSGGILLSGGIKVTHLDRPQDWLLDWFFHPVMVLMEQIKVLNLKEDEVRLLEMLILFAGSSNTSSVQAMDDGARDNQDVIRTVQIHAISRR
ncbi:hypothetical protein ZIOFF_058940 [Zingiber officinale]|uniref:Uncharacterized protein n=1 Tax=Zingiber officinale TaxID=94328 RepID=A0A8J5F8N1_ZINOF|nr:hypothetical protein ZIOFF_058940 [Zingiber officinale]